MISKIYLIIFIFNILIYLENLKLESERNEYKELYITLNWGFKKNLIPTKFLFDIGINHNYIGNGKGENNWGINCLELENCNVLSKDLKNDYYFNNKITYKNIEYNLILDIEDVEDYNKNLMKFKMMKQDTKNWRLRDIGVWGWGVNSEFIKYLKNTYNLNEVKISFIFENNLKKNSSNIISKYYLRRFNAILYFNSDMKKIYFDPKLIFSYEYDFSIEKRENFSPFGAIHISNSFLKINNFNLIDNTPKNICIINTSPDIILLLEYKQINKYIEELICTNKSFKDYLNCDIKKAPIIYVILNNNKQFEIWPTQYFILKKYNNTYEWSTRFSNISNYLSTYCLKGTEIAIGYGFFEGKILTINYLEDKKVKIEILQILNIEKTKKLILLILFSLTIILIIILIIAYFIIKSKMKSQNNFNIYKILKNN